MHAIEVTEHGGPEALRPADVADPSPGPADLTVDVAAVGVNYIDTYYRTGAYPTRLPFIPGIEAMGTVASVGDAVRGFSVGDRVAWAGPGSSYAERVAVPASSAVHVPDGVEDAVAASALLQGMTAHYLLTSTYPARRGDTVLLHAGAGGVGLLFTQLAADLGVQVITTVSTDAKERLSRDAGAAHVLSYGPELVARVREFTGGEGVDAVYDGVGAATFDQSLECLRMRGTLALFGAASGPVAPVDPQRLNSAGSVFLTRPTLAHHVADRSELEWRSGAVFSAIADGRVDARVASRYPLDDAEQAHRDLQARRTTGSLVLMPG